MNMSGKSKHQFQTEGCRRRICGTKTSHIKLWVSKAMGWNEVGTPGGKGRTYKDDFATAKTWFPKPSYGYLALN